MEKRTRGQPKRFSSGKQLISLYAQFCDCIIANGYDVIPSQTEFCRWLKEHYTSADRHTIYTALNKYFPDIKKEFEQLQSDVIAAGGMLGKYQSTMSIFALKNWCKWSDRTDAESDASIEDLTPLAKLLE